MLKPTGALLAMILLVGCGGHVARLDDTARPAKPADAPVAIFITTQPDRPYTEIGLVRIESDADAEALIAKAKKETRRLGGDAAIIRTSAGSYSSEVVRAKGGTYGEAIIIAWK